jgi:uncharacterized protein YgiM (DUF1202 family)
MAHSRVRSHVPHLLLVILVFLFELSWIALPALSQRGESTRTQTQIAETIIETRLRPEPSMRSQPLLRLPAGVEVIVHGAAEDGWYHAQHGQLEGYLRSGDVATMFVVGSDAQDDATGDEAIDEPMVVEQAQRARDNKRQHAASKERTASKQQRNGGKEERKKERKRVRAHLRGESSSVVVRTDLNLRDVPGDQSAVRTTLPRGVQVALTGQQEDGWVEVRWEDVAGWVLGRHLTAHRRQSPSRGRDNRNGTWSRAEINEIIFAAADRYGQPREDMLRVARCESDLIPSAVNPYGGSYGLFQFKPGTWLSTPYAEYDIFDPRANANAAAWMWSVGRRREWVCQ